MAPCIVTRAGEHDPDALLAWLDGGDPAARDAYAALRADEVSRWLCVAHNDAVLFEEGTGELSRIVLGSPVWALLTSIAASYRATGSFARIVGQDGQLRAPATTTIAIGRDAGTAIPTRHFASIRAQSDLEKHGVLALGSPRNSDRIALSSAPMVRASRDAVPLPAQMWAGRIARFTRWVKAQLPAGASSDDARQIFEQAAAVFLYPGTERSARVTAEIVEASGSRTLRVGARVHGSMALVPLDLELEMPMA
jgi:type VI secretion system protein ImpC